MLIRSIFHRLDVIVFLSLVCGSDCASCKVSQKLDVKDVHKYFKNVRKRKNVTKIKKNVCER